MASATGTTGRASNVKAGNIEQNLCTSSGSSHSINIYPPQSPTRMTNDSILKLAGALHGLKTSRIRFCAFSYSMGVPCGRSFQVIMYFMIFSPLSHFVTICPVAYRDGLAPGHGEAWGKDTLARSDWNSRKLRQVLLRPTGWLSVPFSVLVPSVDGQTGSNPAWTKPASMSAGLDSGTLIALTYVLTLEDPRRFHKSRDVGRYLGLRPGRRNSGQSEPQLHISKEGDPYLRTMMVQSAHHILGPFGADRSATLGSEVGRARRQECEETSGGGGGAEVVHTAASTVGER